MLHKRLFALLSVIVALSLAVLACGGGASPTEVPEATNTPRPTATDEPEEEPTEEPEEEPTEEPEEDPTEEPEEDPTEPAGILAGELSISSINAYVDDFDYVHIVGLIFNDTEEPATNIELTLELVDANGDTVLSDFDDEPLDEVTFSPFMWTIGQGETTPFDYIVYTDGEDPSEWTYTVTITDFSDGSVERGDLEIVNDQVVVDEFGNVYLTGELVNLNADPVLVNSLAGALFNDDDTVQAADASYNYARYLAPNGDADGNDRTPFTVSIDGPVPDATSYILYWDADLTEEQNTTAGLSLILANAYVDEYDDLHVVAVVASEAEDLLSVQLVAGLYAEDGTVLDSATVWLPIYLETGDAIPVSFDFFGNVNSNEDELDRVDSYTVQFDAYGTYETTFDVVALATENDASEQSGDSTYSFTGDVVNDSGEALSSAIVVVALYDADENLIASNWTSVYPDGDTFADGTSLPYELTHYLAPGTDVTDWTIRTFVQGYVQ